MPTKINLDENISWTTIVSQNTMLFERWTSRKITRAFGQDFSSKQKKINTRNKIKRLF